MTNHVYDGSRRKLLKIIAAGGGVVATGKTLPDKWVHPVVDSVMLPAHATTTCCDIAGIYCATGPFNYIEIIVAEDGSVSVIWYTGQPVYNASGSVTCGGGFFDIEFNTAAAPASITGTVNCNSQSISGTLTSGVEDYPYVATTQSCQ